MTPAIRAAIGLGANLGDAVGTLRGAVEALAVQDGVTLRAVSRFYRTPAWGRQDQPDFVNAVALVDTSLAPRALLDLLLAVEAEFGRHRIAGERWGPRTLDLDLLLYGTQHIATPDLTVPHPRMFERAFVLQPLAELAPQHVPAQALQAVQGQVMERCQGAGWAEGCGVSAEI